MGSLTVRKLDDEVMRDLRVSAAKRGVSMEQEARERLRQPIRSMREKEPSKSNKEWHLEKSVEEILAIGRRLPKVEFDQKEEFDKLYDYLYE
jgi:plasmid stability protein